MNAFFALLRFFSRSSGLIRSVCFISLSKRIASLPCNMGVSLIGLAIFFFVFNLIYCEDSENEDITGCLVDKIKLFLL